MIVHTSLKKTLLNKSHKQKYNRQSGRAQYSASLPISPMGAGVVYCLSFSVTATKHSRKLYQIKLCVAYKSTSPAAGINMQTEVEREKLFPFCT